MLIECDYRMKLIGIGLEAPPVRMVSYVDRAKPASSRNALTRWYFIPDYNCVRVAADNLGLELVGDVVKLVTEDQVVAQTATARVSGRTNKASEPFVKAFTQKYPELAARVPVFAEMRNASTWRSPRPSSSSKTSTARRAGRPPRSMTSTRCPVETYNTPLQVETVCTAVWKGTTLMTPVGGGVTIQPNQALATQEPAARRRRQSERSPRVDQLSTSCRPAAGGGTDFVPLHASGSSLLPRSTSTTRTSQTLVCVGPGLEQRAERLEPMIGVVARQKIGGVESACVAAAAMHLGVDQRPGRVGRAVFAVGAARENHNAAGARRPASRSAAASTSC